MRILHTADLHLGIGKSGSSARVERFLVFRRVLNLVEETDADILLISGDFIEQDKIEASELAEVIELLSKLETRVFISPGNHDPASPVSIYRQNSFSNNVHVFLEPKTLILPELKLSVSGAGFKTLYQREGLVPELSRTWAEADVPENYLNLALLHGEYTGQTNSIYNPIKQSHLLNSPFDYLALGHIHKPNLKLECAGETYYAQAGSPEPLDHSEVGVKGVHLLEFTNKRLVRHDYISTARNIFLDVHVNLEDADNNELLIAEIQTNIETAKTNFIQELENYSDYKAPDYTIAWNIYLVGSTSLEFQINLENLELFLEELDIKTAAIYDKTSLSINADSLEKEDSLRGVFYRKLRAKIAEDPDNSAVYNRALELGLRSFREE